MTTAAELISRALHLFGLLDQTEDPQPIDIANNVGVLNDLLRSEMADGAAQFLMQRVAAQVPAGQAGQIYSFSIGTANPSYLVQNDAVGVKSIYVNDIPNNNRETREAPTADVVRNMTVGRIMKWHQERQSDGSILVTAWQAPAVSVPVLIEFGGRLPLISAADGSDVIALPPEGIHDVTLLLGLTVSGSYGRPTDKIDPVLLSRAETVDKRWRAWARGQQWLRLVRS